MLKIKKNSKVINFGCRLNSYESEIIKSLINKNNINELLVFNTCAVTREAERKAMQAIRKYKRDSPKMKIAVTGCSAQINYSKYLSMKSVDFVIGNSEKMNEKTWLNLEKSEKNITSDIMKQANINNYVLGSFDGKARAYVEIQQGCNHRCTFCIIPYGRGNSRSVPLGLIYQRVKKLVSKGYKEVVLTGVDITDYGIDLPGQPSLSEMVKRILNLIPELKQLRLSSIDCSEITNDFWDLIKNEERLMPHLHISLQSGDDLILKRMKRRHNRKQAIEFCQKAKSLRPDIVFGADIITGFPTESEKMFRNSCTLLDDCDLTFLHVFPYSQRTGTPASKMPQISRKLIKERSKILRNLGEKKLACYLKTLIGKEKNILIEKNIDNYSIGRTEDYFSIKINKKLKEGDIYKYKVKSADNKTLFA